MTRFILGLLALTLVTLPLRSEDWPRWRGPRGDGTWNGPRLPEKWQAGTPKVLWRRPIGTGYAGLTASDGRVFTLDLETPINPKGQVGEGKSDGVERILCFDAKTGREVWSREYLV